MARPKHLLILGGTGEALALARKADAMPGLRVTTSLAGRTRNPAPHPGAVRVGGFGGSAGLADFLRSTPVDLVIDATHPFAKQISRNAALACTHANLPRLSLVRDAWVKQTDDRWIEVADLAAAANGLDSCGARVFLTVGRRDIAQFAGQPQRWFLVRMIDPPEEALPLAHYTLVLGRGPFDVRGETALLTEHGITAVVAKNSGGEATYAKIAAARALGLPVVMVERPPPPAGPTAATVDAAVDWLAKATVPQH